MRRFYVEIPPEAFERLAALAIRDRRSVRAQAAVLLEEAVRREPARRRPEPVSIGPRSEPVR